MSDKKQVNVRFEGAVLDQLKELVQGDQRRRQAVTEITENLMSKGPADAPVTLELFATYGAR